MYLEKKNKKNKLLVVPDWRALFELPVVTIFFQTEMLIVYKTFQENVFRKKE